MINKLCTSYLPSKLDINPSPRPMVKSHEKKFQNYFRIMVKCHWIVNFQKIDTEHQQEKMVDFDYCKEQLASISTKTLLWQCYNQLKLYYGSVKKSKFSIG